MFTKYRDLDVPAHAYGRFRRDPLLLAVTAGYDLLQWAERLLTAPEPGNGIATDFFDAVVTVREVVAQDENVVALTLAAPGGETLPAWSAGAHIDLRLDSGAVRQYSLCGDPGDRSRYRIAVRLIPDGRGGSAEVHRTLEIGTVVRISKPRNAFPLAVGGFNQRPAPVRLIAGGIGITPILPMLAVLDRLGLPWSMIYCGRTRESLAFLGELERFGGKVTVHLDDEDGIATPDTLLGDLTRVPAVYTCGPPPMIESLRTALADRPEIEFHYERFSAAPVVDGREFRMRLAATGEEITVGAEQTALAALLTARPDATFSCQQGFCRSCAVRVLDGTPDHRSTALSPAELEQGYFLPCVSRSDGCLTLDL
ncbi:PDR/VanB family oxidoreductase [Nocardia yamanashiensis]|uniref:PDR/VanB family oxidoreductase n=1 Tax=Nocardia yamanashiensis TaxID=209247 RepID=UPI001E58DF7C|nr:PDR/VanB family oxidoreductase [Nocardia yamanashiensis]UGT44173.1 PDR/VanB family oxidoreductase [Nocardia yamanashiensis]